MKFDIESAYIFFEIFAPLGARDGDDVSTLRDDPGQSQLRWSAVLFLRHLLNFFYQIQI